MRTDAALETDILAAVLADSRLTGRLMRLLEPEDFATSAGRTLFDAITQIAKRDGVDAVAPGTVRAELKRTGADERTVLVLLDPLTGIGSIGSFEPKCRALRDLRRQRRVMQGLSVLRDVTDIDEAMAGLHEILDDVSRLAGRETSTMAQMLDEMLDERERELRDDDRIRSGLPTIDDRLGGGFAPRWFVVVGSRTGVGKTTLGVQVTYQALRAGKRVLYVALEEGRTQIVERLVRHAKRLPRSRTGELDPIFTAVLQEDLRSLPLVVESINDLGEICSSVTEMALEREGLGLVVVDYIGLVRSGKRENRVQEVSEITARLKNTAMAASVPILGLAQVNRSPLARTDHRPMLSDLRDSGSLEQDADVVVLLHRPGMLEGDKGELALAKHRFGAPKMIDIHFEYAVGHIQEVTHADS